MRCLFGINVPSSILDAHRCRDYFCRAAVATTAATTATAATTRLRRIDSRRYDVVFGVSATATSTTTTTVAPATTTTEVIVRSPCDTSVAAVAL